MLDKNKVLEQHDFFRIFATTNTVGLGDTTGLYHGTQQINQGQMDRWNIVSTLNYLPFEKEQEIYSPVKDANDGAIFTSCFTELIFGLDEPEFAFQIAQKEGFQMNGIHLSTG